MSEADKEGPQEGPRPAWLGTNKIEINIATLQDILQQWLNRQLLSPPFIASVDLQPSTATVKIMIGDKPLGA